MSARGSKGSSCVLALVAALLVSGCLTRGLAPVPVRPLRISEVEQEGDPARRASVRFVVAGLRFDEAGDRVRAEGQYERALQVDPTNPYVYLALARHRADGPQPEDALSFLSEAAELLRSGSPEMSPRVEAHLVGLRGQVLVSIGDVDRGRILLERASEMAPEVWGDGRLDAGELL